jgi:ATP-dependent DNA helicase RecG
MEITDSISSLPFVGPNYEKKLEKLGIKTISDLLHHIPHRYLDFSKITKISDFKIGETVTVIGTITSIRNQTTKSGRLMQIGQIEDESGKITLAWFSQPFLTRMLYPNLKIAVSGETSWFAGKPCFFSPQYEKIEEDHDTVHTGKIVGIYPAKAGITSKWLKARVNYAIDKVDIPEFLTDKKGMVSFKKAIHDIHFPKTIEDTENAKERLAFNEFFNLLVKAKERKKKLIKKKGIKLNFDNLAIEQFTGGLPFTLTNSQEKVIKEILDDLKKNIPMNRLLQGDVGSGKTIVAAIATYATSIAGYQTVFLAPTQILANQHFESIKKLFPNLVVSLVTANSKQLTAKSDVYVGTHALLNKTFENVGLLIIDEQHKFGVKQINFLQKQNPHVLTMTATPIPRTIAQTLFSDMDLSVIDELPKNRQKIKTWLVPATKREAAYEWINSQINKHKSQCFVICPLVEESESETLKDVKSVKKEFVSLQALFSNFNLGLLHGKLKDTDKNKLLLEFSKGNIEILVSTPVVEVGIDIPNATIMLVEASDRFGLAQLHQLRGRVGRGTKESYCLLFTENESEKTVERLTALTKTSSGFELAELDLKLRGAGDVLGTKQSGFGNLKRSWCKLK